MKAEPIPFILFDGQYHAHSPETPFNARSVAIYCDVPVQAHGRLLEEENGSDWFLPIMHVDRI